MVKGVAGEFHTCHREKFCYQNAANKVYLLWVYDAIHTILKRLTLYSIIGLYQQVRK